MLASKGEPPARHGRAANHHRQDGIQFGGQANIIGIRGLDIGAGNQPGDPGAKAAKGINQQFDLFFVDAAEETGSEIDAHRFDEHADGGFAGQEPGDDKHEGHNI